MPAFNQATSTQATRLAELRRLSGLSQREAGAAVGVSNPRISAYETDETVRIKMPVLKKLAELYHTTPEYIETGVRTGKESFNSMPTRYIVSDNIQREHILMVPHKAEAGYRKNFSDEDYLGTLPVYSIPGFEHGHFRMFEVAGDSMRAPDGTGFEPGDLVICEHVEDAAEIVDGTVYVIVTTDGICLKRVSNLVNKKGYLLIESDNPEYKPDIILPGEVLEMWSYRKKLTI